MSAHSHKRITTPASSLLQQFKSGHWTLDLVKEANQLWNDKPSHHSLTLLLSIQQAISGFTLSEVENLANIVLDKRLILTPAATLRLQSILSQTINDNQSPEPTPGLDELDKKLRQKKLNSGILFFNWRTRTLLARYPLLLREQEGNPHSRLANSFCDRLVDWAAFSETLRSGTIAIVGNAGTELGKQQGKIIDQAEHVFRFNSIITEPEFIKDYGTRTSAWVISPSFRPNPKNLASRTILISGIQPFRKPTAYWRHLAAMPLTQIVTYPSNVWYQLVAELEAPPTAGLLTLSTLLASGIEPGRIAVYGITRRAIKSDQNHYGDSGKRSSRHDWQKEATIADRLITKIDQARR